MAGPKLPSLVTAVFAVSLVTAVFAVSLVVLVLDAGGGPGWSGASAHAVFAARMERLASAPLYDALAGVATLLPVGEVGFRLSLLSALLAALTLAGVVAAVRVLVPREVGAALVAVALLVIAPTFREAAAFAGPAMLAACGAAWSFAFTARYARARRQSRGKDTSTAKDTPAAKDISAAKDANDTPAAKDISAAKDVAAKDAAAKDVAAKDDAAKPSERAQPDDMPIDARDVVIALIASAVVVGSAPWLGAVLTVVVGALLWRSGARDHLVLSLGALGLVVVALWLGAQGSLPPLHATLVHVAAAGRGASAILVGAGLVGVAFAALTALPGARFLAIVVALAAAHEVFVGQHTPALLAVLAIGVAIIPSAVVRATMPKLEGTRRHALAIGAGLPLVGVAVVVGATFTVDDPRATPTRLAHDLARELPPGPGVFVANRGITWLALQYEFAIAGMRPDLALVPPTRAEEADAIVANTLRANRIAGSDSAAFGRLDVRRALPRGRGFQLLGDAPPPVSVAGPADYATRIGHEQAILLALERARHEAASNRLDAAARALGQESRFGAADLAILAVTLPSAERPALFGFLPLDERPAAWMLDAFGDDLAWVAGLPPPALDERAPLARRLHAKWREVVLGKLKPDDPSITALGPRAVRATRALFASPGSAGARSNAEGIAE